MKLYVSRRRMRQSMKLLMRLTGQYKEFQTEFIVEDFAVSPAKFRETNASITLEKHM